ncbi:MAG: cation-translocating P-type ATPase [Spirochaetales bacterium]
MANDAQAPSPQQEETREKPKGSSAGPSWWSLSAEETREKVGLENVDQGLSSSKAEQLLERYGANVIERQKPRRWYQILLDQFKSSIMVILAVAAVAAFIFEGTVDGIAVSAVIVANALIGFFTELRAVRRMEALAELGSSTVAVRRDGEVREVEADKIVPGDVFIVEEGLEVPADARLLETNRLKADESTLTGESEPVAKQVEPVDEDTELMERSNMLFKGTFVSRGSGEAVVVSTGQDTQLGEISQLVSEATGDETPLEERLNKLGRRLVYVTIGMAIAATISGIITGRNLVLMIETGIALAVAAIPEGLPIVATIALASGLREMAKRHALVNRLSSVETLGSTTVICTDKTGTLTENELSVAEFAPATADAREGSSSDSESGGASGRYEVDNLDGVGGSVQEHIDLMRKLGALCTNVQAGSDTGDPLEVALVRDAEESGLDVEQMRDQEPEVEEIAFDSSLMEMATIHKKDGGHYAAVKGAPERVLEQCKNADAERWSRLADEMSADGLRVLAIARRELSYSEGTSLEPDDVYKDLEFLGLIGLRDPARPEIADVIADCQRAGIKVAMVTGDNSRTANAIADEVGITTEDSAPALSGSEIDERIGEGQRGENFRVFARVTPKQKLEIIDWYQGQGEIVAMTGDGVNDAPALEKADIGIAMGDRGTDVAAESSDMVLTNNELGSVVAAVRYGRIIFENIRKFVIYLMSCNLAEILAVGVAAVAALPLPLLPLQILYLNIVTGVFPALALGVGPGSGDVMNRPPRDPEGAVLESHHWRVLAAFSTVIAIAVLGAFFVALGPLGMSEEAAVTVSFLTLAFSQIWHVFNMRGDGANIFKNDITSNRWVWGAIGLCLALIVGAVMLPGLSDVMTLTTDGMMTWLVALGAGLVPLILGPLARKLVSGDNEVFS